MATKAIKFSNSTTTYLPVTDATLVQMKVNDVVKSVHDVIIEDEEITAAAWNDANKRLNDLEDNTHEPTGIASGILNPTNKNITNNSSTGQQEVITSINVNSDGHVLSYTKTSIYSTDTVTTNTDHTSSIVASGTKGTANVVSDVVITSSTSGSNTAYTVKMTYISVPTTGFVNVKAGTDATTTAVSANANTAAADSVTDTMTIVGGNKWIKTGVNTSTDTLYMYHTLFKNADGSITANANADSTDSGSWGASVVNGITLSYDAAGHISSLSLESTRIPIPSTGSVTNNMKYVPYKTDAEDLNSTWLASIGTAGTAVAVSSGTFAIT